MRTDKTLNGKRIYQCDICGIEVVAGNMGGKWLKIERTRYDPVYYFCESCKDNLNLKHFGIEENRR